MSRRDDVSQSKQRKRVWWYDSVRGVAKGSEDEYVLDCLMTMLRRASVSQRTGLELSLEFRQDVSIDVDMAVRGINAHGADSNAFTEKVIALAQQNAEIYQLWFG